MKTKRYFRLRFLLVASLGNTFKKMNGVVQNAAYLHLPLIAHISTFITYVNTGTCFFFFFRGQARQGTGGSKWLRRRSDYVNVNLLDFSQNKRCLKRGNILRVPPRRRWVSGLALKGISGATARNQTQTSFGILGHMETRIMPFWACKNNWNYSRT